ncbi:unnamed protein product [Brassica rapa subsp. narinosa]
MNRLFTKSLCSSSAAGANLKPPPPDPAAISNLILSSPIQSPLPSNTPWTPHLVNSILKRLWNHGPKALHFFHLLDRRHRNYIHSPSSFNLAIDIAARLHLHTTVWSLIRRMRSLRIGPSPKTFAIVAERFASSGKPDKAVNLFLNMHEHGCSQDLASFNTILDVLCKSKRVEKAYELFKDLRGRFSADVVTYNVIVNGWCLIKRTPKALEVLKEMVERGITPNLTTYNTMLKGFFRSGQVRQGWEFFLEMKKRNCGIGFDVVTYTTVVHGLGVSGEVKRAKKVFDEMIREGVLPSVATHNALIQVLCKKDTVENAVSVFEEMVRKGYEPNVTTYNVLIRGLFHAGEFTRGEEMMRTMEEEGGCEASFQTYNMMMRYYLECGEVEKALGLFERMGSGGCLPNLDTYNILISGMFVRKRSEDMVVAGKLLVEMVERGFVPRKFTFNRVLNGLLLTGNQGFAKEILRSQSKSGSRLTKKFRL